MTYGSFSWGRLSLAIYPGYIKKCNRKLYLIKYVILSQFKFLQNLCVFWTFRTSGLESSCWRLISLNNKARKRQIHYYYYYFFYFLYMLFLFDKWADKWWKNTLIKSQTNILYIFMILGDWDSWDIKISFMSVPFLW